MNDKDTMGIYRLLVIQHSDKDMNDKDTDFWWYSIVRGI